MGNKKYIVVLVDGASDYIIGDIGNRTPLQAANKPEIDNLAKKSLAGIVKTIPEGIAPGSDTANLSILGYDPLIYSTGRSSLEAVSMGIHLSDDDITYRCNLVTLSDEENFADKSMVDHSAGEITTGEAGILIDFLAENLNTEKLKFYPGVSYRHVIVCKSGKKSVISDVSSASDSGIDDVILTPPHDIIGKRVKDYLPSGTGSAGLLDLMEKSVRLLKTHPVNIERSRQGKNVANSIWLWARAKKPNLDSFIKKYGISGSVVSAVDLIKGIGICAGLEPVSVEGATGNINTNFSGKAEAAISRLKKGRDFVYIHVEAPDECSHQGSVDCKIKAIELIDKLIVGKIKKEMEKLGFEYKMMILPDHPTPIIKRTHTSEPVPFIIYDSSRHGKGCISFDEFSCAEGNIFIDPGYTLMDLFLKD